MNSKKGYRFNGFYLDCASAQLYKHNEKVTLHEKSILLLTLLCKASPQTVTKDELHQVIWPETIVSDWSLSRLVSDTRAALGESGEQQSCIKTERGKGFSMPEVTRDSGQFVAITSHRYYPYLVFFSLTLVLSLAMTLSYKSIQQNALYHTMVRLKDHQDHAYTAFIAQAKRRNELVAKIEKRLKIKRTRQFELFFYQVFDDMNEEERFICQQMRAYSDAGIYNNNLAVLTLLELHPRIFDEIPLSRKLAEHLRVWLDKYTHVFSVNPKMCLIYVGVEDGVPYPSKVDNQIYDWLALRGRLAPKEAGN